MGRIILALAVLLLVSNFKTVVYASETYTTSDGYTYTVLSDGTVEITGYTGDATELVIPETIDGRSVARIGNSAFYECLNLTSIEIPEGVVQIGERAFERCMSLKSVKLSESVTKIGEYAFYDCCYT